MAGLFLEAGLGLNPFLQLLKLAGAVSGAIRRDDFDVQAAVGHQFRRLLHGGRHGIPAQSNDSRRIERGNEKLHGRLRVSWPSILTLKAAPSRALIRAGREGAVEAVPGEWAGAG